MSGQFKFNPALYVTYRSDTEVLICTPATEENLKTMYFWSGKRRIEDYERDEVYEAVVEIRSRLALG